MAYLTWVVRILLFLVLLGFAVRNLDIVHVHAFLGYEWQAPLVLVMLAALVLGVVVGVAGALRTALFLSARNRQPASPALPENCSQELSETLLRRFAAHSTIAGSLAQSPCYRSIRA